VKALFDTSVLVAAMVEGHPRHPEAFAWLERAHAHRLDAFVCAHSLAELYAVLSTYPARPRLSPELVNRLIRENVTSLAKIVSLSRSDYSLVVETLSAAGQPGAVIYDALIARAAQKARVDRLLTLNPRDFLRVWPDGAAIITAP
jgi:predicted nucleic acid-binding protein